MTEEATSEAGAAMALNPKMIEPPTSTTRYLNDLTAERVRELLYYDPLTGFFTWRIDRSISVKAGDCAGCINSEGYIRIRINGTDYKAHRLAWLHMTGKWPSEEIDHVNLVKHDNRWINLREATPSENSFSGPPKDKLSGLPRGVEIRPNGKFQACIGGNKFYLGTFDTVEEAAEAYAIAAQDIYGAFYTVSE